MNDFVNMHKGGENPKVFVEIVLHPLKVTVFYGQVESIAHMSLKMILVRMLPSIGSGIEP